MFEKFSPEYQFNKRFGSYLLHCATEHNIELGKTMLLFKSQGNKASAHLYHSGSYIKTISLSSILEFFGRDFNEGHQLALDQYLNKVSQEEQIHLSNLNIIMCEMKGELGAHIYEGPKHKKKIPALNIILHFLSPKNE